MASHLNCTISSTLEAADYLCVHQLVWVWVLGHLLLALSV